MRAGQVIGVAAGVLGLAVLATVVSMPPVLAAGAPGSQAASKADQQNRTVVIRPNQAPNVVVRQGTAPVVEVFPGGGSRLGVQVRDLAKEDVTTLKLPSLNGAAVVEVTRDSAAERAGVKAGDVIVQFDGENVRSVQQLTRLIRETAPGRTVKMAVVRDGKRLDLDVTPTSGPALADVFVDRERIRADVERQMDAVREQLRELREQRRLPAPTPPVPPVAPLPPDSAQRYRQFVIPPETEDMLRRFNEELPRTLEQYLAPGRARLGVRIQELTPELAEYFGVKDGVLVTGVDADTPAAKAGLKAGDVITAIDAKTVASGNELVRQLRDKSGEVTIALTRDRKALTLKATLEAPRPPARRIIVSGRPV